MLRRVQLPALRCRRILALTLPVASVVGAGLAVDARQEPPNELDAFMARVLERREESWRRLHDYVLDEEESHRLRGRF